MENWQLALITKINWMVNQDMITDRIIAFVREIGIEVRMDEVVPAQAFVPGIAIQDGALVIDMEKLKYPGDILHEAGHLAVSDAQSRKSMGGILDSTNENAPAGELMAIAWSYAAATYLSIDPHIVFHEFGYQGGGSNIVDNFSEGRYLGLPMLQWVGLCLDPKHALLKGCEGYPTMLKWLRD